MEMLVAIAVAAIGLTGLIGQSLRDTRPGR
jgi:hypothetical protein